MTDDVGFAAPSTFGGVIPTPALDRIANAGLRHTNFHSTSLRSPTRAALITGRNHYLVGFGVIAEQSTGFPGYNSIILQSGLWAQRHGKWERDRHISPNPTSLSPGARRDHGALRQWSFAGGGDQDVS
jgi:arylsulfatase A-like enzyme